MQNLYAQTPVVSTKCYWVITISQYFDWQNYAAQDTFKIAVYGSLSEEYEILKNMTQAKSIHDRKTIVYNFKRIKDIKPVDVLFVNSNYSDVVPEVFNICKTNKTLLITDNYKGGINSVMVNLLMQGKDNQYEVNGKNCSFSNAVMTEQVTAQGGSTSDLRDMYIRKERELIAKEQSLAEKKKRIDQQKKEIEAQLLENKKINQKNERLEADLKSKESEIAIQRANAAILTDEVNRQQLALSENQKAIEQKNLEISDNQQKIEEANIELKNRQKELDDREQHIKDQEKNLSNNMSQIERQRMVISGVVIFVILVIVLIVLILKSLRERNRANMELKRKNFELNKQKEEIDRQAKELEGVNVELEKLSIVAGRTQNAVEIMDRNGYFQWVNAGYTRMFGYTLQLLKNELDDNLVNVSKNPSIRNILYDCVSNKHTVVYDTNCFTRQGKEIFCQVTLTPILNDKNEVSQLVAIYTDISKLKEQEASIRSQNEELEQQKGELEIQKNKIELQNQHIKDGILYAQTIQNTILPPKSLIEKDFDCFVLFRPKDIVSGDFYWYNVVEDDGHKYHFVGDLDCTGHGVPGAFMSLIGNRILNEVIVVKKQYSPRDIMDQLNKNVIKALKQDQSTNNDGMDTCFCRIEKTGENEYTVVFCGAKRPLYYYDSQQEGLQMLKGDRKSIGGVKKKRNEVEFTDQTLVLHSGDMLYLSSDGIIDQNDKNRVRFGSDKFQQLINDVHLMPMNEQVNIFARTLDDYRQDEEQRDDISVIGIKFR